MDKKDLFRSYFLYCSSCNRSFEEEDKALFHCPDCEQTLEIKIMPKAVFDRKNVTQTSWGHPFEKYLPLLPLKRINAKLSLGECETPLIETAKLSDYCEVEKVYIKNETLNPTYSFKDRGTIIGLHHALGLGYSKIGTVSTGNMAASVAAYGARAGVETFILVKDEIVEEKLNPIAIYQPHLIKIKGDYSKLYRASFQLGEKHGIYFINSDVPIRVEGSKIIAFEIWQQLLDKNLPDWIIIPTSAGGNFRGIYKGFSELRQLGLIKNIPKLVAAQASGCAPIVKAFEEKKERVEYFADPETVAGAVKNPFPPSGSHVLAVIHDNNGQAVAAGEDEIVAAQKVLAQHGFFVQPAAALSLAALMILKNKKIITPDEKVVLIATGSGLRHTGMLNRHQMKIETCDLSDLEKTINAV